MNSPLSPAPGVEISGVERSRPPDDATAAALREAAASCAGRLGPATAAAAAAGPAT